LRARGRSGGQNGLLSVIEELGGAEFPRLRLGVAPVGTPVDPADWADFVLRDFDPDETQDSGEMIGHGVKTLACWLEDGFEAAVSRFNRRIRPETE
jgi:PTH1 family peptidyl-tRNA hydrolase